MGIELRAAIALIGHRTDLQRANERPLQVEIGPHQHHRVPDHADGHDPQRGADAAVKRRAAQPDAGGDVQLHPSPELGRGAVEPADQEHRTCPLQGVRTGTPRILRDPSSVCAPAGERLSALGARIGAGLRRSRRNEDEYRI